MVRRAKKTANAERVAARAGVLFCLPWMVGLAIFYAYPLLSSIFYSFNAYNVVSPIKWVGLLNYQMLIKDKTFWLSISNTLIYAAMSVPLSALMGIGLALLLNVKLPGSGVFRTVFFMPTLVPVVATSILWQWLLNAQFGVVNYLLSTIGIVGPPWLGDPLWAKPSLVLMAQWTLGNAVIVYLAGLQDISRDYYEAADIDGANSWQRAIKITLPLLTPVIFFNVVMSVINTLQIFTLPYAVTLGTGKPANSLMFYSMYLYNNAFAYMKMGYASAMAWILFVIIIGFTLLLFRSSNSWVFYQDEG